MRYLALIILLSYGLKVKSQTIGGRQAFTFLNISPDPLLTGAGNINASYIATEVGLTANNPSLLNQEVNAQLLVSFTSFLKGVRSYSATGAHFHKKSNITFGGHINFIDYGSMTETDASGTAYGNFRPVDFVVQLEAARNYLENWSYGISLKLINSVYNQYKANGIAFDVGVLYKDTIHKFSASMLAKNMGFQVNGFAGEKQDLPFDIQVGLTKILRNAPLGISLTAYHINQF
ncbi:MAG TPA: PorV/PorQ family protein, partial [Flavisolibacter sp.]|nr:PorV/PorQ family protein [Flavisolibacter sp.]